MAKEKITKDMSFAEILEKNPKAMEVLSKKGMHCCGCPMAQMETLEEGCASHGLNADKIVEEINGKEKTKPIKKIGKKK